MRQFSRLIAAALLFAFGTIGTAWSKTPSSAAPAPLGSPKFSASLDRPIGWRGDGTGRYPGATPPTTWSRVKSGAGYETNNIIWMTPLPNTGVSCPLVVGDRVFVTSDFSDLVCLDKRTGQILWIRSNMDVSGLSAEERKSDPAFDEKLTPLLQQLEQANLEAIQTLNAMQATAPNSAPRPPAPALVKKRAIEKQIEDQLMSIDKKKFQRNWAQAVYGYSGPSPVSDGKHVYAFFANEIVACYDLDGNRKWITLGKNDGSPEKGNFTSPLLYGGRLLVWANEMRCYDVDNGKLLWTAPCKTGTNSSVFGIQVGNEPVVGILDGYFMRIRDGKPIWKTGLFGGGGIATPISESNVLFVHGDKGLRAYKIPESTEGGTLTQAYIAKADWADDELPVSRKFERGENASPLLVDGLIYQLTSGGGLLVNNAATGEAAYRKVLPMKPHTEYWAWGGASASPTLAGKYIYLMDNQGITVVIEPGRQYKEVAKNVIEESRDGKDQVQNLANPVFDGSRMYYRTPGFLYCIGDPRAPVAAASATTTSSDTSGSAGEPAADQTQAIADLRKLGGKVRLDEKVAGHPAVTVDLTDANLTDDNIAPLESLAQVRVLSLRHGYKLTDGAMAHLKGLVELQILDLRGAKITDAGLDDLKELTKLRTLDLAATKVTDDGVKQLQQALPTCKITRR